MRRDAAPGMGVGVTAVNVEELVGMFVDGVGVVVGGGGLNGGGLYIFPV